MTVIHNQQKHKGEIEFKADVPLVKAPKISATTVIDGITYYLGENGKQYIADRFDAFFKRAVQFKLKGQFTNGKFTKGDLIGQAAWR